ncbi:MAG: transposase, partial [Cloacibacterium sp.]
TDVWRTYRNRGDAENRIKELKADFGAESFNLKGFFPTEAALIFSMIAYNLMSIFRLFVLQEKRRKHYLHYDKEPLLLELILKK